MPLTNITFTKTATITLSNALSTTISWEVSGGTIVSGQGTLTVTYYFTSSGSQYVRLTVTNNCSTQTRIKNYTVCHLITGLAITGLDTSTEGTSESYTSSLSIGNLVTYFWSATNGASITSGQGSVAATILFGTGLTSVITLDTTDCDGNHYTTTKTVTLGVVCTLIISCSFS